MQAAAEAGRNLHLVGVGPAGQNPFLALIAPLHGGKKVVFPVPKHDQMMMGTSRN